MPTVAAAQWLPLRDAHRDRVDALIGDHQARAAGGQSHPVVDFLFTYYSFRPAALRRWHPGYGVVLGGDAAREYTGYSGYHAVPTGTTVEQRQLVKRRATLEFTAELLAETASRPAQLGCFGLHEWAMVYRADDVRHGSVPLRLGRAGTDAVVEAMPLRCTHYDAFRFFTPDAAPRNATTLTRAGQRGSEQPGCLHANMDLYKWCYKLVPLLDSALLLDCFELALAARELDMRASPYDLTDLGYRPVPIETPTGRAEYARAQAELSGRSADLRARLLTSSHELLDLIDK